MPKRTASYALDNTRQRYEVWQRVAVLTGPRTEVLRQLRDFESNAPHDQPIDAREVPISDE